MSRNAINNTIQNNVPIYCSLQYHGCNSIQQFITYEVLLHIGVPLKIVAMIILFL